MPPDKKKKHLPPGNFAENRKARHDYDVLETVEAGMVLAGTEVKSVRGGGASLAGSYAIVLGGELFAEKMNIAEYAFGNRFNHEPARRRKLLVHRKEIEKLRLKTEAKGLTLVPLRLYLKHGRIKVEIGVCRGKAARDKRETLKRRAVERDMDRAD